MDYEKNIQELNEKMDSIIEFIGATDKVTNILFCEEEKITGQTLLNWFKRGCPRLDNRHVSRSGVKKWKRENCTHETAGTKRKTKV